MAYNIDNKDFNNALQKLFDLDSKQEVSETKKVNENYKDYLWYEIDGGLLLEKTKNLPFTVEDVVNERNQLFLAVKNAPNDIAKSVLTQRLETSELTVQSLCKHYIENEEAILKNREVQKNLMTFERVKQEIVAFDTSEEAYDYFKNLKGIPPMEKEKFIMYCSENNVATYQEGFEKLYRELRSEIGFTETKAKAVFQRVYDVYRAFRYVNTMLKRGDEVLMYLDKDRIRLKFSHIVLNNKNCSGIGVFYDEEGELVQLSYDGQYFNNKIKLLG